MIAMKPMTEQQSRVTDDGIMENILLVDDRPENLLVYKTILEELGQNLVVAHSGEEALKLVLRQDFAVILLDVNMPLMNGFETASLIRKRKKSSRTPIIFLTAFTDEISMIQGYASGAVDFLPTPVVPEVLKAKVRVFIELSSMRRQAALQAEERVRREAAEEAAREAALLSMVSESLARAKSQTEILQGMARLMVPHLADFSVALLKTMDEGQGTKGWTTAQTPDHEAPLDLANHPWLTRNLDEVLLTSQARIFEAPSAGISQWPQLGSILLLPIAIQDRPQGILLLARHRENGSYQLSDIPFAVELSYRAGIAIENVSLLEKIREADRRKDEFLGMLAHELRNPLGPIYNSLQLQKVLPPTDPRIGDLREIIDRQAKHMGRLIDDLLDATRLSHGKILLRKERCDLAKIVCQTAEDYRAVIEGSGIQLDACDHEIPVWVNGDPTRLVQAIGNLLHNAHKFTRPGGRINVRLDVDETTNIATVTVSDTGIGIESKMLHAVFEVFRQAEQGLDRSRGGLGLGLALVRGLVELHGGNVQALSEGPDKGAQFRIRLPVEGTKIIDATEVSGPAPIGDNRYRILLIEDNVDAAASAKLLLSHEGHEVETASTAALGLKKARTFRPQIILCDIGLPEMDGYQTVRAIRKDEALAAVFVIALTGYGREEDQRLALDAGFDLHLTKPIDYHSLRQALHCADKTRATRVAA